MMMTTTVMMMIVRKASFYYTQAGRPPGQYTLYTSLTICDGDDSDDDDGDENDNDFLKSVREEHSHQAALM